MRLSTSFLFISALMVCTSACQNSPDTERSQTERTFETGCYVIRQDSIGEGLYLQRSGDYYYLDTTALIDINDFKDVSVSRSTGEYLVNVVLTDEGAQKFTKVTEAYLGRSLGFVIENKLVMTPKINQIITGNSILIAGGFTEDEMLDCYRQIKSSLENRK